MSSADQSVANSEEPSNSNEKLESVREKDYTVESIVGVRVFDGGKEYKVRWEGFTDKDDSWLPPTELEGCKKLIKTFERRNYRSIKSMGDDDEYIDDGNNDDDDEEEEYTVPKYHANTEEDDDDDSKVTSDSDSSDDISLNENKKKRKRRRRRSKRRSGEQKRESLLLASKSVSPAKSPKLKDKKRAEKKKRLVIKDPESDSDLDVIGNKSKNIADEKTDENSVTNTVESGANTVESVANTVASTVDENEEEYEVEHIVKHRTEMNGEIKYFVKWLGYDSNDNTWESATDLSCKQLVDKYWEDAKMKKKKKVKKYLSKIVNDSDEDSDIDDEKVPETKSKKKKTRVVLDDESLVDGKFEKGSKAGSGVSSDDEDIEMNTNVKNSNKRKYTSMSNSTGSGDGSSSEMENNGIAVPPVKRKKTSLKLMAKSSLHEVRARGESYVFKTICNLLKNGTNEEKEAVLTVFPSTD